MRRVLFTLCSSVLFVGALQAQWSADPAVNTPVCTATANQTRPQAVTDHAGGVIIVWQDLRDSATTGSDIYAQRFDLNGVRQWQVDGIPVCNVDSDQLSPTICSDDSGGAIITWYDYRNSVPRIYAQHIGPAGDAQWAVNGIPVDSTLGAKFLPVITPDGNHGAIIAWQDFRNGAGDIYAQHVTKTGQLAWTFHSVGVCTNTSQQTTPQIVSDGQGGAIIAWNDYRFNFSSGVDIYAQRVDTGGTAQWTADGVAVVAAPGDQSQFSMTADGNQGAIIAYATPPGLSGENFIAAQRVDGTGATPWATAASGGLDITNPPLLGVFADPVVTSDGSGGAIIAWWEAPDLGIEAQRLDANGNRQWNASGGGIVVNNSAGDQMNPSITGDGAGGALVAWRDDRNGLTNVDIYSQRVDHNGSLLWLGAGLPVSTAPADQAQPAVVLGGTGGLIAAWEDARNGAGNSDIYCNRAAPSVSIIHYDLLHTHLVFDPTIYMDVTQSQNIGTGFDVKFVKYLTPPPGPMFNTDRIESMSDMEFWTIDALNMPPGATFLANISFTWTMEEAFGAARPPNPNDVRIATRKQDVGPFDVAGLTEVRPLPKQIVVQNVDHLSQWVLVVVPESTTFRSIQPESLATARDNKGKLGKSVKRKADKVEFCVSVTNSNPKSTIVNDLHIEFSHKILPGTLSTTPPFDSAFTDARGHKWNFLFDAPIDSGTTVSVCGFGDKGQPQKVPKYWWTTNGVQIGKPRKDVTFTTNQPRLPMPNLINLCEELYAQHTFDQTQGLIVGVSTTNKDSARVHGWIHMKSAKDILKTIVGKNGSQHTGAPACFCFTKEKKNVPPELCNNRLIADQTALRLSIAASAIGKTPPGFGELTFFDSTQSNPFNGLLVRDIATYCDQYLSGYPPSPPRNYPPSPCDPAFGQTLDSTIRIIVAAFSGPVDTATFAAKLVLTGISRPTEDVPFLHVTSGVIPLRIVPPTLMAGLLPEKYSLDQNYPNPFNPSTVIGFHLPTPSVVTMRVYDVLGRQVAVVLDHQAMEDGDQEVTFNGASLASGVYFYRIVATPSADEDGNVNGTEFTSVKKMILLK